MIVHGTSARGQAWALPGGAYFEHVAYDVGDRVVASFQWSGGNSHAERVSAGDSLAKRIRAYKFRTGEQLNIIAHSHGGNVALWAINAGLGHKVDNLVTLGTPSRGDYRLKDPGNVSSWISVYNIFDEVQVHGGGDDESAYEIAGAARTHPYAQNVPWNYNFGPFESHSRLHSGSAWDDIRPRLFLKRRETRIARIVWTE